MTRVAPGGAAVKGEAIVVVAVKLLGVYCQDAIKRLKSFLTQGQMLA